MRLRETTLTYDASVGSACAAHCAIIHAIEELRVASTVAMPAECSHVDVR